MGESLTKLFGQRSAHFYTIYRYVQIKRSGYGFSYVYHRSIYPKITFNPHDNFEEDLHFVQKIKESGLPCRAILDTQGVAVHVIHRSHASRVFPQFILPSFIMEKSFPNLLKAQSH